jgi:hypothetical protein
MDLTKTLAELREQRDDLNRAIASLERLAIGRPRGRGRPTAKTSDPSRKVASVSIGDNRNRLKADAE